MMGTAELDAQFERAMRDVGGEDSEVLADMLIERGDPRGELITAECRLFSGDDDPRWRELAEYHYMMNVRAWLGPALTHLIGEPFKITPSGSIEDGWSCMIDGKNASVGVAHGFVRRLTLHNSLGGAARLTRFLSLDVRKHLTSLGVVFDAQTVKSSFELLASSELPRLIELSLSVDLEHRWWGEPITAAPWRAFPQLERLRLYGARVYGPVVHDHLKTLCVHPLESLAPASVLPALTSASVSFADADTFSDISPKTFAARFTRASMPKLEELYLGSNEPLVMGWPYLGGSLSPYALVSQLKEHRNLKLLTLPSPRDPDDVGCLRQLLESNSGLEIVVQRCFGDVPGLDRLQHDNSRLEVAHKFPWPSRDHVDWNPGMLILMHDDDDGVLIGLVDLIWRLEKRAETDGDPMGEVWEELFACLGTLPRNDAPPIDVEFSASRLTAAFKSLDDEHYAELVRTLNEHTDCCADRTLRIRRGWGW